MNWNIKAFFDNNKYLLGSIFLMGCILYSPLLINGLSNSLDCLWTYPWYATGDWEVSIGRFFWVTLDMLKAGLVSIQLQGLIYILMVSIAIVMILRLFDTSSKAVAALIGLMMLSYPVVCISMSYSFMLVCFASAFLISVLAACCIIRFKPFWVAVLSGAILIALSMGAYQAYLGFVAIILLMYFINGLIFKSGFDGIGFCVRAIISVLVGGILYYLFVQTSLMIYDLDMAEYRGASGINIGSMLRELPYTIINSYKDFFDFFFTDKIRTNAFGMLPVNALCFFICVLFIADVVRRELKRGSVNGILLVIGFLAIPVAANLIDLIAVGNRINILMSIGISFVMPLMLLLIHRFYVSRRLPRFALIALACLSVYANGTEILNDQISMDYGRDQTMAVADCIYDRLMDVPDIQDKVVFIHGQAADSSIFAHTAWYDSANAYECFILGIHTARKVCSGC